MINKDPGESRVKALKRKKRNHYTDLWALVIIGAYILVCLALFNTFNPFTSTWGYFRIATEQETKIKLDSKTTMIKFNTKNMYMEFLVSDLEKGGFKIIERQTNLLNVEKDGLKYSYYFDERSLFGTNYILVIMKEEK